MEHSSLEIAPGISHYLAEISLLPAAFNISLVVMIDGLMFVDTYYFLD